MSDLVIISNLIVMISLFAATLYRIKLEKEQVKTTIQNAKYAERIRLLRKTIKKEKNEILEMSGKDVLEFLKEVCKDEE